MFQLHQKGGAEIQEPPWETENKIPPWENNEETAKFNEDFKETYELHENLILENHVLNVADAIYNFPVDNSVTIEQVMGQAEDIFDEQSNSFKVNLSLGLILYNNSTDKFRYFKPYSSDFLLKRPVSINSESSLAALRKELNAIDFNNYVLKQRPNSQWKPILVTNIRWSISKTKFPLGAVVNLPSYLKNKKSILGMDVGHHGKAYDDNLCLFRCYAFHVNPTRKIPQIEDIKFYFRKFRKYMAKNVNFSEWHDLNIEEFEGLDINLLYHFELCFKVNINVFQINSDGFCYAKYRSRSNYLMWGKKNTMNLNLYEKHLSYITNLRVYSQKYECKNCKRLFKESFNYMRHKKNCLYASKLRFPGKFYAEKSTIFQKLENLGIKVEDNLKFFDLFAVFDFEACLQKVNYRRGKKILNTHQHVPISVSICSNVPKYTKAKTFVDAESDKLVSSMLHYLYCVQKEASIAMQNKFSEIFSALETMIETWNENQKNCKKMIEYLFKIEEELLDYCKQLPVLGFNSSRYDLNLIKTILTKFLVEKETNKNKIFTIKKGNSYCTISNKELKFLDISHYLAPGFSYSDFLKSFEVEESKSYFPYEWFDCTSKLDHAVLPPYEAFYSSIKEGNTLHLEFENFLKNGSKGIKPQTGFEKYRELQTIWNINKMQTFKDFLIYYNEKDVVPFIKAVEQFQKFYKCKNIDIFKMSISIPGVARKLLFQSAFEKGNHFALFDEKNKDLYTTFNKNITGGPSIIFKRCEKVDQTLIRNERKCENIIGYDCNSLYLYALGQEMPVGPFIRRIRENGFIPEKRDKYLNMYYWMDFVSEKNKIKIDHKLNKNKEYRIGPYLIDGIHRNNVYEYNGCYYHGHKCWLTNHLKNNAKWLNFAKNKRRKDKEKYAFLLKMGYKVHLMKECQFLSWKNEDEALKSFLQMKDSAFSKEFPKSVSEEKILKGITNNSLFGVIECDISIPEQWTKIVPQKTTLQPKQYFEEMCPLFCNVDVKFADIGEHMQNFVKEAKLSIKPRKMLVSGIKAQKILLATPLLKWYLNHGMLVTKIYQVIEYTPSCCFTEFTKTVTDARRKGDLKLESNLLSDSYKLLGNSAYGGLLLRKENHKNISFVSGIQNVMKITNYQNFRKMEKLDDSRKLFEVECSKRIIKFDLPSQLGFFVLQYAKLRMLEFYYDFLDIFCDRKDFEYLQMDTDSAYIGITKKNLDEIVSKNTDQYFKLQENYCHQENINPSDFYLPRRCCEKHSKHDNREPGLFKIEFTGNKFVGLSSKTYIVSSERKTKLSSKGVNRRALKPSHSFSIFENVLNSKISHNVINKGFQIKNQSIFTYEQTKCGLTYFYCKRKVLPDGVNTIPLNVTLKPCSVNI